MIAIYIGKVYSTNRLGVLIVSEVVLKINGNQFNKKIFRKQVVQIILILCIARYFYTLCYDSTHPNAN